MPSFDDSDEGVSADWGTADREFSLTTYGNGYVVGTVVDRNDKDEEAWRVPIDELAPKIAPHVALMSKTS